MELAGNQGGNESTRTVMDEIAAAAFIGVCDKTLRKLRQAGKVPHARVGTRVFYLQEQLYEWLEDGGTNGVKGAK